MKLPRLECSAETQTIEHLLRTAHKNKLWFANLQVRHDIHSTATSPYPTTLGFPPNAAEALSSTDVGDAPHSMGTFSLEAASDGSAVVCEEKMRYGVVFSDDAVKQGRSTLRVGKGDIDTFSQ